MRSNLIGALLCAAACTNPLLQDVDDISPPNDTAGCGPDATAENLTGTVVGDSIEVRWTSAASNEDGFIGERRIINGLEFNDVVRLAKDATTYVDHDVQPGRSYVYRIRSFRAVAGEDCPSAPSVPLTVAGLPLALTGITFAPIAPGQLLL